MDNYLPYNIKLFLLVIYFCFPYAINGQQPVQFYIENIQTTPNTIIDVPVKIRNFQEVSSFQFTIKWDIASLQFLNSEGYNLSQLNNNNFGTAFLEEGLLTVLWSGSSTSTISIVDEETIFILKFKVIGRTNSSRIEFTNSPVDQLVIRVDNLDILAIETTFENGLVSINTCEAKETIIDTVICHNAIFNGLQLVKDTTITNRFTLNNGCDSLVTLNVEVKEKLNAIIDARLLDSCQSPLTYQIEVMNTPKEIEWTWNFGNDSIYYGQLATYTFPKPDSTYLIRLELGYNSCKTDTFFEVTTSNFEVLTLKEPLINHPSCQENNGKIELRVEGGLPPYHYVWEYDENNKTPLAQNLPVGSYKVQITDANNCQLTPTLPLTKDDPIEVEILVRGRSCANTNTVAIPKIEGGTAPFSFMWSNGQTDSIARNFSNRLVHVTITDITGCTVTSDTIKLDAISPLSVKLEKSPISCFGECDGMMNISINGGTPPYTILMEEDSVSETVTNLCHGNYFFQIIDFNRCHLSTVREINEPLDIVIQEYITLPQAEQKGSIALNPYGGTRPYTYKWNTGATNSRIDNLEKGVYSVTLTDANGCSTEKAFNLMTTNLSSISSLIDWKVFPIPAKEHINIHATFSEYLHSSFRIIDINGQTVYQQALYGQEIKNKISIEHLTAGLFFLRMETSKGCLMKKIIVQK